MIQSFVFNFSTVQLVGRFSSPLQDEAQILRVLQEGDVKEVGPFYELRTLYICVDPTSAVVNEWHDPVGAQRTNSGVLLQEITDVYISCVFVTVVVQSLECVPTVIHDRIRAGATNTAQRAGAKAGFAAGGWMGGDGQTDGPLAADPARVAAGK